MSNNSKICRTCLNKSQKLLQIFNVLEIDEEILNISDILAICTGLNIIPAPNIPDHICMECVIKLSQAFVFRKQAISADQLLKQPTLDIKYIQLPEAQALSEQSQIIGLTAEESSEDVIEEPNTSEYLNYTIEGEEEHGMYDPNGGNEIGLNFPVKMEIEVENDSNNSTIIEAGTNSNSTVTSQGNSQYLCIYCTTVFNDQKLLTQHIRSHHSKVVDGKPGYECDICGDVFAKKMARKQHMTVHNMREVYQCELCEKEFVSESLLKNHLARHNAKDARPFTCDLCDAGYKNKYELKRHQRIHTGERPYNCPDCGFQSRTASHNAAHRKKAHPSKESILSCPICMKTFKEKHLYNKHQRVHDPKCHLACQFCNRKFAFKRNLVAHEAKYHTFQKPTECEICGLKFMEKKNLLAHMSSHIKADKPFR